MSLGVFVFGLMTLVQSRALRIRLTSLSVAVVFCCLGLTNYALAQAVGGTIAGTVKDVQGGVLPEAVAVFTNTNTGVRTTVQTNGDGLYRASNLQPGPYDVKITFSGFSTGVKSGVVLNVGANVTIDFTLQVATADQNVTVAGTEASVDLASSTLSYDVTGTTIRELPLNGRDFTSLATLNPSVSTLNGEASSSGSMRSGRGKALSVSGSRPAANNFLFDGISMNDQSNNTPGSILGTTLGVDAIDQFTLLADTFPAEYGNASGAILNAVTRSGTNKIHGSGFYFGRNSALDALNKFDVTTLPNPAYRRHQYGGTLGGPLIKDKMFWFGNYEAISQLQGTTQLIKVPTNATWALADPAVQVYQAYYPKTTAAQDASASCQTGTGITVPNAACSTQIPIVNTTVGNEKYGLGKFDYKITEKDSFASSYYMDRASLLTPDNFNNQITETITHRMGASLEYTRTISSSLVNIARVGFARNVDEADPSLTKVLNPALNQTGKAYDFVPGKGNGSISISGNPISALSNNPKAADFNDAWYTSYQAYEDFLVTKGTHAMKFGGNTNYMEYNNIGTNLQGGSFTISSGLASFLQNGQNTGASAGKNLTGSAGNLAGTFAATLNTFNYPFNVAGSPQYVDNFTSSVRHFRMAIIGGFAQDDWKALKNLTLNLGVRYEVTTSPWDTGNKVAILRHLTDSAPTVGPPISLHNPSLKNISPRIGFSYDPLSNGKTAIRGGYGIFDSLDLLGEYDLVLERSFPFFTQEVEATSNGISLNKTFPSTAYCLAAQDITQYGYVDPAFNGGNCAGQSNSANPAFRTAYIDPAPPRSYIMQWNLNIEQQLGGWAFTAGYVGSRGIHLLQVERNMNTVMPTVVGSGETARYFYPAVPIGAPLQKLNTNFASINCTATFNSDSYYDGFHLSVKHNLSKGFQVIGSYAFGKSLDESSSIASTSSGTGYPNAIGNPQPLLPRINKGRSDFDIKNNATISLVYDVPKNSFSFKPFSVAASGWEVSGIYRVQSGSPFTATLTGDETPIDPTGKVKYNGITETDTNGATAGERPNVTSGCQVTNPGVLKKYNKVASYINVGCLSVPNASDSYNGQPGIFLGNMSRNMLSAPGYQDVDMSFIRNDNFGDRFKGQLRLELFNAANHPNYAAPVSSGFTSPLSSTSTFGQIQSTGGNSARLIQYGYKVTF
jgi:hypothetical protein